MVLRREKPECSETGGLNLSCSVQLNLFILLPGTDSGSGSVRTSASTGNLNNNNRIYLKTVDKELHSDYDLCSLASNPTGAGFRPTRDPGFLDWEELLKPGGHGLWLDERSGATEDVAEGDEVSSRRSSGSWEKVSHHRFVLIDFMNTG